MAMSTENLLILAKEALSNEDAAVALMTKLRWPNGVACPRCGCLDPYKLTPKAQGKRPARKGLYKCSGCKRQFSVTTGSVFEASHLPLSKWLMAIHLMSASKKGMSAHQLHRMLGCTYRAAWFCMHRLRYAMSAPNGLFSGVVEVDETFIGANRPRVGRYGHSKTYPTYHGKTPVMALVERGGRAKAFPLTDMHTEPMRRHLMEHVDPKNTHLMTDEYPQYPKIAVAENFKKHDMINHTRKEYVRGHVHTNTVEGFFSLLKRGITGSFHHISRAHLYRYCDEFAFRYSNRIALGINDGERAAKIVLGAEGKRLTYKKGAGTRAA